MTLAVGVVGTGIMGTDHATLLQGSVLGAHLVLLADPQGDRADALADRLGCRAVRDPFELVADPAVEAVVVASPDPTHADLVRACAAAGKPVLCEKPLAPSLAEAAALVADLGAAAALVSLGFMRRFDPGYTELRAALRAGRIGAPLLVHSTGRGVASGPGSTAETSVTGSAVHDLDIVPWLLGSPVVEVSWQATRASSSAGFADPQLILLRCAAGVLATVETFLNARYGYDIRCEVVGESGALSLVEPVRVVTDTGLQRVGGYAADWRPRFAEAYRRELQAWVDQLRGGPPSALATAADGLRAAATADAVLRSRRAGGAWTAVPAA